MRFTVGTHPEGWVVQQQPAHVDAARRRVRAREQRRLGEQDDSNGRPSAGCRAAGAAEQWELQSSGSCGAAGAAEQRELRPSSGLAWRPKSDRGLESSFSSPARRMSVHL